MRTEEPQKRTLHLVVHQEGERLDRYLAGACPGLSRSRLQRLIAVGSVTVNEQRARPALIVRPGDRVLVHIQPPESVALEAEAIPLQVVYQDPDLLVIDKPAGLVVHPAPGHPRGTMVNALLALCPDLEGIQGSLRPGIVHRLDKGTSGLMVVAKNDRAQQSLTQQLKERTVVKRYLALIRGVPRPPEGAIEAPIARDPRQRQRMAIVAGGREARTRYRVQEEIGSFSLVEATPLTGRTHQIRVHLAAIGHPIVGDSLYGPKPPLLPRPFLHATLLGFRLPSSGQYGEFRSELPADLREALERLKTRRG